MGDLSLHHGRTQGETAIYKQEEGLYQELDHVAPSSGTSGLQNREK